MEVRLVVACGKAKGREIPLPITVVVIGRGKKCHLRPHCRLVSKMHCAIARWAGKVVVRDLKSANGTFINGKRVQGEVRVQDGDLLQVGTLEFRFRIARDAQANPQQPLPPQVVRPSQVKWLLDTQGGSSVLKPSDTINDRELASLFKTPSDVEINAPASAPDISAGDYLREYFRKSR